MPWLVAAPAWPPPRAGSSRPPRAATPATLVIDTVNYPTTLDPGKQYDSDTYSVYRNIFDQLLRRNPRTGAVVPWLATSWKQTDPTTWTFTMRPGMTFSDGTPVTAADAAFSINRILDKKFASQQYANFSAISKATASGCDAHREDHGPVADAPQLPDHAVGRAGEVRAKGRRREVRRQADRLRAVHGRLGHRGLAGERSRSTRAGGGRSRRCARRSSAPCRTSPAGSSTCSPRKADLAVNLTPDAADQVKRDPKLAVLSTPTERIAYLAFNTIKGGAANDPRVRHAIALAIDYSALIKNLQRGYAKPINSLLTPLAFGYDRQLPDNTYDPAQAKRLVAQAGAKGETVVMATSPSFNPQIVQAIQANLADVGLRVQIRNTDQATYLKKVQSPGHDWGAVRFGRWSCSCLDADGVVYPLFHTGEIWSSYSSPAFDGLVEQARKVTDRQKRTQLYDSVFQLLAKDLPGLGLFQDYAIYGANARVRWTPDAQESFYLDQMKVR